MIKRIYLGGDILKEHYNGIYIRSLILESDNKESVEIRFKKGLNIISGSSNTGKSYIYECINYVLGGRKSPKDIIEAREYGRFILEIEGYDGIVNTIVRERKGQITNYNCEYKEINNNIGQTLLQKFKADNSKNISTVLTNLCNINYSKVISTQTGKINNFTFREMIHLNMIDEERVINTKSIVYDKNGGFTKAKNESVFRIITSGKDDSDINSNTKKKKENTNVDFARKFVDEMKKELGENYVESDCLVELNEIGNRIKFTKKEIEDYNKEINDLKYKIQEKSSEGEVIEKKKAYIEETIKRFKLLKKNHEFDIERLDFIDESKFYLEQLENLECPICGNERIQIDNDSNFTEALIAEKRKLLSQINDLEFTIFESELQREIYEKELINIKERIIEENDNIENTIKNGLNIKIELLEGLMESKQKLILKYQLNNKVKSLTKLINDNKSDSENSNNNYKRRIESKVIQEIIDIAKNILVDSKVFDNVDISFNYSMMDLTINNADKETYGKGYRALINSAFCIAINKYMNNKRLPNLGFVIIDSPLTAFKDKENKEKINEEVKVEFYNTLNNIRDIQIIIIENQEPPVELEDKIVHHHFSGNDSIDRKGFIM